MSRTFATLPTYTPGADTPVTIVGFLQPAKDNTDLLALGCFARNLYGGGSESDGFGVGSGTGQLRAYDCLEFEIDNTSNQVSSAANLVCQVRIGVRVENVAMSFTPRIYNLTDASVPTQSGAAACSAILDDYSGANQQQTISLTPANGKKKYIIQGAKSADTYQAWLARIYWDVLING